MIAAEQSTTWGHRLQGQQFIKALTQLLCIHIEQSCAMNALETSAPRTLTASKGCDLARVTQLETYRLGLHRVLWQQSK